MPLNTNHTANVTHLEGRKYIGRVSRRTLLLSSFVYGCGKIPGNVGIDPGLLPLVPGNTHFLAGVDFKQLADTGVFQKLVRAGGFPSLTKLENEIGLDLRSALSQMVFAAFEEGQVMLLRGTFSEASIGSSLKQKGVPRSEHKGTAIFGNQNAALAVVNTDIAIAGTAQDLIRILDAKKGNGLNTAIRQSMATISGLNQIWFTGDVRQWLRLASNPSIEGNARAVMPLFSMLSSVKNLTGGANFSKGIDAYALANVQSAEEANRLRDALRGLAGLARLNTKTEQMETLELLDRLRFTAGGSLLRMTLSVKPNLVDSLIKLIPRTRDQA